MTPEEEFIARLTCRCLTARELWTDDDGYLKFHEWMDPHYHTEIDLFIIDANLFIPAGVEFQFTQADDTSGLDSVTVELRS